MKLTKLFLVLVLGITVGAISYWFNTYNEMNLFGVHIYYIMIAGSFLASYLSVYLIIRKPVDVSLIVTLGVLISVLCRIFFDINNDPTSHNLFPFEVIAALVITIPSTFAGSYISKFINKRSHM